MVRLRSLWALVVILTRPRTETRVHRDCLDTWRANLDREVSATTRKWTRSPNTRLTACVCALRRLHDRLQAHYEAPSRRRVEAKGKVQARLVGAVHRLTHEPAQTGLWSRGTSSWCAFSALKKNKHEAHAQVLQVFVATQVRAASSTSSGSDSRPCALQCVIVVLGVIVRAIDNALADCYDFCPGPHGDGCEPCAPIKHGFFPSFIVDHDFNKTCAPPPPLVLCADVALGAQLRLPLRCVPARPAPHACADGGRPGGLPGARGLRRRNVPQR